MVERVEPVSLGYKMEDYSPPRECGDEKCRDFFMEFIYICVIPTSVLLVFTFILSLCFCCSHSKRSKKSLSEEEQQRYDTIKRASKALRRMSYTRDTPLLDDRYGTMTLDRTDRNRHGFRSRDSCYSAPGTLQRHRNRQSTYNSQQSLPPPPMYRLPPQYPEDERGDDIAMVDLSHNGVLQVGQASTNNGYLS